MLVEIAANVWYANRATWGADAALPRLGHRISGAAKLDWINHHTVVVDNDVSKNLFETHDEVYRIMRSLQRHPTLGDDVPYNLVLALMPAGILVCEGRGFYRTGAHTIGRNTKGLGVAWMGDFHNVDFDPSPWIPMVNRLLRWVRANHNSELTTISGHRDYADRVRRINQTACPGDKLYAILPQLSFSAEGGDEVTRDELLRAIESLITTSGTPQTAEIAQMGLNIAKAAVGGQPFKLTHEEAQTMHWIIGVAERQ